MKENNSIRVIDHGLVNGHHLLSYKMINAHGMELNVLNYGGTITSIKVPDQNGKIADVVLGYDEVEKYTLDHPSFGSFVGRYANRIGFGQFDLDGKTYHLNKNIEDKHTLHGGLHGFARKSWDSKIISRKGANGVMIYGTSPDMDEQFPGNLYIEVEYLLTDDNEVQINYRATTDKATVLNLTNHAYFNLRGAGDGNILDHMLQLNAAMITEVNADVIPTGLMRLVVDTPLDFRAFTRIGDRINDASYDQIQYGSGYDHNFVLDNNGDLDTAATVYDPLSGRTLEVLTDQPGVQLYAGNWLNEAGGKQGKSYLKRSGFCLETQHFPDAPNQPNFPSTRLNPGEEFTSTTIYRFTLQ